ncbi:MAG: glycosyltransferase family 4 protein [Ardenticatenaceae bacterium]|nr:glycosyltransferase family 4 protein [Ardenticatenaceae bacterium]HBY97892.1 glycosyl transferase family 1 [Chloroflexota bacterium]
MRILHVSKALVVGAYQAKMEALAALPDVELTVAVPPSWKDERGIQLLEVVHTEGYELWTLPMIFNGSFHLHFYPGLHRLLDAVRPDLLHFDEEPYNLATAYAALLAHRAGAHFVFFTWQNLQRAYPVPFSWFERLVYRLSDHAIVGNRDAGHVLQAKGYAGPLTVIPQFGVDPERFRPASRDPARPFTIGYAGRFVEEKGLLVLLAALAALPGEWQFVARGSGPLEPTLLARAAELDLSARVRFRPPLPSTQMASFYQSLDLVVLPSLTRPNWKEQFGRVLVEAMACGVPPVGSASGEIPNVIGDAGVVVAEGDAEALRAAITHLMADPGRRMWLSARGRQRVLAHFTQAQIARRTWQVYREVLGLPTVAG